MQELRQALQGGPDVVDSGAPWNVWLANFRQTIQGGWGSIVDEHLVVECFVVRRNGQEYIRQQPLEISFQFNVGPFLRRTYVSVFRKKQRCRLEDSDEDCSIGMAAVPLPAGRITTPSLSSRLLIGLRSFHDNAEQEGLH